MFVFAGILLVVLVALAGFYLYRVFRSAAELFVKDNEKFVLWLSLSAAVAVTLPLFWFFDGASFWGLFLLHLVVISLVCRPLGFLVRRMKEGQCRRLCDGCLRLQVLPLIITAALLIYGSFNIKDLRKTEYRLDGPLEEEFTVALIADVHYGAVADADYVKKTVAAVNAENPDIVILGGDIADEGTEKAELYELFDILGELEAEHGVYYVFGNHDFSHYSAKPNYTPEELRAAAEDVGIVLLEDETVRPVEGVVLAGRKDVSEKRLSVSELLEGVSEDEYVIVADHQPVEFGEKAAAGVDLQLSGHTHGGQIFPIGYISTFISSNEMNYGEERVGGMTAIVSSGVAGWSFPVRTQAHSEYVIVVIH